MLMVPPLSRLVLLDPDASPKKELDDVSAEDGLLPVVDPVAFLSMLERLRLPASLLCFFPGLAVVPSYD